MDKDQSGSLTAIVYIFYSSKTRITPRMFSWVTSTSVNYRYRKNSNIVSLLKSKGSRVGFITHFN